MLKIEWSFIWVRLDQTLTEKKYLKGLNRKGGKSKNKKLINTKKGKNFIFSTTTSFFLELVITNKNKRNHLKFSSKKKRKLLNGGLKDSNR